MLSHYALKEYVNRPFESHTWIKSIPYRNMSRSLKEDFDIQYKFKTKPMVHQLACMMLGLEFERFIFLNDMGTGKTKIILDLAQFRMEEGTLKKPLLAVVPNEANIIGWEDEVKIHSDLKFQGLWAPTPAGRQKLLKEEADVYAINYAGLQSMMTSLVQLEGKKKKQRMPNEDMVEEFCSHFGMLNLDELHLCKSPESLTTHLCNYLSESVQFSYGSTGTLMNRPEDIWSQYRVIDQGETFGVDPDFFYETFYREERNYQGYKELVFIKSQRRQLHKMVQNKSIRYVDTECHDLPKKVTMPRPFLLPKEARKYYDEISKKVIESIDDMNKKEKENNYIKWRMICSGFIKIKGEEGEDDVYIDFKENPKLDILEEIVTSMPHTSKLIVFHDFQRSGLLISERLKEMKINHVRLWSGTKSKSKELTKFKEDPQCHVMVSNIITGHAGHNWQHANYTFYYDPVSAPIIRDQADKRTRRKGQKKHCYYIEPIARYSVEERIIESLKEGRDLSKEIVDGKALSGLVY